MLERLPIACHRQRRWACLSHRPEEKPCLLRENRGEELKNTHLQRAAAREPATEGIIFWFRYTERSTADVEALSRADAEAERASESARMLEERRATKRASATPLVESEESAMNDDAEKSAEAILAAVEAVLTETRENS